MNQDNQHELILFVANPIHNLCPLFVRGAFIEVEFFEYGNERDWDDSVPEPPGIGLWVWEFTPTGGDQDYMGEYNDVDIDKGQWRPLTAREWHFVQQGEPPWEPVRKEEDDFNNEQSIREDKRNFQIGGHWSL